MLLKSSPCCVLGILTVCGWAELYVSAEASGRGAPPLPAHRPLQGLGPQEGLGKGQVSLRSKENQRVRGGVLNKMEM